MIIILIIIFILTASVFKVFKILINVLVFYNLNISVLASFSISILKVFNSFNIILLEQTLLNKIYIYIKNKYYYSEFFKIINAFLII